jgi:hypothetical protein
VGGSSFPQRGVRDITSESFDNLYAKSCILDAFHDDKIHFEKVLGHAVIGA